MNKNAAKSPKPDESLIGRTLDIPELVSCQTGAVVSRTIVQRSAGTVTLFAFDQNQSLSEHSAPFDALVIGLEGQAEISIDSLPHRLGAGQMIIMPANRPHALKALTPFTMALVMIKS
jgi:quercetin dioxygenase-like cupin family protein